MNSLPVEILIKIFDYAASNKDLMLVCHHLYEVVCEIEKYQHILHIKDEKLLLNTQTFSSIINSKRRIDSIKLVINANIEPTFWTRLEAVILKHRDTLKSLEITWTRNMPMFPEFEPDSKRLPNILYLLPQDCPQELTLNYCDFAPLKRFLAHRDVKKLKVTGTVDDITVFERMHLTSLTLIAPRCDVKQIVRSQPQLKHLKIVSAENFEIHDRTLDLPQIESLDVPLDMITNVDCLDLLEKLHSLKSLRSLSFQSSAAFTSIFCDSMVYANLRELDISVPKETIDGDAFDLLAEKFPALKSFSIRTGMAMNIFRYFCTSGKVHFESLLVENTPSGFVSVTSLRNIEFEIQQTNVRKLVLINRDLKVMTCKNDLQKCLQLFPNIEYLAISGSFDTQNLLEHLLKNAKSLRGLVIKAGASRSTTRTMNVIKEHGKRMRLIVLQNYKSACDVENLKTFFDGQFDAIFKRNPRGNNSCDCM